jgi:hypothetical protein
MIRSAKFSFVRFEHPADNDFSYDIPYTLPVFQEHNLAFQFVVDDDRDIDDDIKLGIADTAGVFISAFAGPVLADIKSYRYKLTGLLGYTSFDLDSISVGATTITYSLLGVTPAQLADILYDDFGIELTDDYFVLESNAAVEIIATVLAFPTSFSGVTPNFWHQGYVSVTGVALASTDCFTYALLNADDTVLAYSNQFMPVDEEAFTSLLTYGSEESNFEFVYGDVSNIIRIPICLKQPQFPKVRTVDRKSQGTKKLLSALVEKEYLIETEQMPEVFHECLAIALSHDSVVIRNVNIREITVEVIETENYAPDWDGDVQFTKAKGKVKVAAFGYSNSNC